jgi:lincosamide nucleotidyltransferase A/C/D/E
MTSERDAAHDLAGNPVRMEAEDALKVLRSLEGAGVCVWLDGGWGVDALLREQTRVHSDLDLVVALADADLILELFVAQGFAVVFDARPTRVVLCDRNGHRLDLHTVSFDAAGAGIQIQEDGSAFRYPAEGFCGEGAIQGQAVPCLTPAVQVLCHRGYVLDANDVHDLQQLHQRFGIPVPLSDGDR